MTTKEEIETELRVLESLKNEAFQVVEERRRRIDLIRGVALGLLYGVLGNLFVVFFFPIDQSLLLSKYDATFVPNIIICVGAFVAIVVTTWQFYNQLTGYEAGERMATDNVNIYRKAIASREEQLKNLKRQEED